MTKPGSSAPDTQAKEVDLQTLDNLTRARQAIRQEIGKVIIGQEQIIDDLLTGIFARGHCLMVGVPGLAKTLMVNCIAQAIDLTRRATRTRLAKLVGRGLVREIGTGPQDPKRRYYKVD